MTLGKSKPKYTWQSYDTYRSIANYIRNLVYVLAKKRYTWDAVTSMSSCQHVPILEVYAVWTKTELKYGNLKVFMSELFADRVLDWRIIPHTTVGKRTKIYDVTLLQQVQYTSNMAAVTVV